jgi:hypothetical protein
VLLSGWIDGLFLAVVKLAMGVDEEWLVDINERLI